MAAEDPGISQSRQSGRCHRCGYALSGLPVTGACPECGSAYTDETAGRLRPWPSAFSICTRLGWPIGGLLVAGAILASAESLNEDGLRALGMIVGYAMVVSVAINSYFQVRSMLRRSLPDNVRTRGPVAIFRAVGTTACVIILVVFVGLPFVFGVGCLILLASVDF